VKILKKQLQEVNNINNENNNNENKTSEKGLKQYVNISYLNSENADFKKSKGGILSLRYKEKEYARIFLYRAFPFTLEDEYISVRDKDGNEIGIIKNMNDFEETTRKILKKELEWIYFCPDIKLIYDIKEEFGYAYLKNFAASGRRY
jgi:hypothetical protein